MPLMTRAQASPFPTTTVQLILITSINAGRFNLRERVRAPTPHVSHPPHILASFATLVPTRMKIYPPGVFVNFFFPSSFANVHADLSQSFRFIIYRKFNGGMKNRGEQKKLQLLNSEKCKRDNVLRV